MGAGPSRESRHYAFDTGEEEDDRIVLGVPAATSSRAADTSGSTDRWHDGRPVLTGFTLDPKGVPQDKW